MPLELGELPRLPSLVRIRSGRRVVAALVREHRLLRLEHRLDWLLAQPVEAIRAVVARAGPELEPAEYDLLAPVDSQEVWASGVTYLRSREARIEEFNRGRRLHQGVRSRASRGSSSRRPVGG